MQEIYAHRSDCLPAASIVVCKIVCKQQSVLRVYENTSRPISLSSQILFYKNCTLLFQHNYYLIYQQAPSIINNS